MTEIEDDLNFQNLNLDDTNVVSVDFAAASSGDRSQINIRMTNQLETEALKSVNLVGYEISENEFKKAIDEGPKSTEYTKLVNYLTNELRVLCNIDECVNAITTPEDSVSFVMETSSFLNELGCPYASLTQGHVSDRLSTVLDRLLLIQHLVAELMAARILRETRPEKKIELKLQESSQAADLRKILQTLGFPKPPANITMQTLMQKLTPTVQNTVQKAGNDLLGNPIFFGTLSDKQWQTLSDVHQDLHEDFLMRREMLLKRLDCTIQSFQWSDKTKGKDDAFNKTYTEKRKLLKTEPDVDLSDLLASRDDLAIIEKTSSALVRKNTKSAINKVIIGQVPDRGGRTSEQAPPPPEMPPWQQRSAGPAGGGGGFRGGRQGQGAQRGGGNFGGQQGGYGGGSFSQGGSNYSQSQSTYSNYGSGDSRGGGRTTAFDSAGSYKGDSRRGSDYSYSGNNSNNYSKGSNDYSRGGGSSDYSRGGNDYSRGGSNYPQGGGNDYSKDSRGGSSYSQGGGNDYSRDSRGGSSYPQGGGSDYSRDSRGGSSYSQGGGNDYSRDSRGESGYSQRSGGNSYSQGGGSDYSRGGNDYSRGGGGNNSDYSRGGNSYSKGNNDYARGSSANYSRGGYDSAGSYGGYSQDYQEPKRAKTFDQFQQNKTTYADQYVQESQHNQQYHSRDTNRNRGGRGGRSNYNRGGGGSYR